MARMPLLLLLLIGLVPMTMSSGCCSPYHSDQGALAGGLLGAGTGAVVGHALGNTAGGALVRHIGALSGAAIGHAQGRRRSEKPQMIAQQLGRQVDPGAVTINDVLAMTRAHVNDDLIINHINAHGMAAPLQTDDFDQPAAAGRQFAGDSGHANRTAAATASRGRSARTRR